MPTEQRRWTVNLISCINKVSDQWKMLANIQGKGRALDEKSESLLMEYSTSQTQRGKRKTPSHSQFKDQQKRLCVQWGTRLKHSGGHASERGIFSSACFCSWNCVDSEVWVIMLERCVAHCWSRIRLHRESTECNKQPLNPVILEMSKKLWGQESF